MLANKLRQSAPACAIAGLSAARTVTAEHEENKHIIMFNPRLSRSGTIIAGHTCISTCMQVANTASGPFRYDLASECCKGGSAFTAIPLHLTCLSNNHLSRLGWSR